MLAVAQGQFPLAQIALDSGYWGLLKAICEDELPRPDEHFSLEFSEFIFECLVRNPNTRKSSRILLSSNKFLNRGKDINRSLENVASISAVSVNRSLSFSVESLQSLDENSSGSIMSLSAMQSWKRRKSPEKLKNFSVDSNLLAALDSLREDHLLRILFRLHQYFAIHDKSCPIVKIPGFQNENQNKWNFLSSQLCLPPENVMTLAQEFLDVECFK